MKENSTYLISPNMASLGQMAILLEIYDIYNIYRPIYNVIMALIVLVNLPTIIVLVKIKSLRRIPSNLFILFMSMVDFTMGLAMIYYNIPRCIGVTNQGWMCVFFLFILTTTPKTTVIFLLLIGLDRMIAVTRPLQYKTLVTHRRVLTVCVIVILFQLIHPGGYFFYYGYKNIILKSPNFGYIGMLPKWAVMTVWFGEVTTLQVVTTSLYGIIIYKLKKQNNTTMSMRNSSAVDKRTTKAIKTMATVLFFLFVCWCPGTIWISYIVNRHLWISSVNSTTIKQFIMVTCLVHANSFVNPLIYCWHNKEFRDAYKRLVRWQSRSVVPNRSVDTEVQDTGN